MAQVLEITNTDHVLGSRDGRIVLIEYGDFQCRDSRQAYWTVRNLRQQWAAEIVFVYRHFPLKHIHPMAQPAAEASEFAAQSGLFWEMHDAIYEEQQRLSLEMLLEIGEGLNLDAEALRVALVEHWFAPQVDEQHKSGEKAGVSGTPTFFLNGVRHNGNPDDLNLTISNFLGSDRAA